MKQRPTRDPAMQNIVSRTLEAGAMRQSVLEKFPSLNSDYADLEVRVMGSMVFADLETSAFKAPCAKKEQKNDEA